MSKEVQTAEKKGAVVPQKEPSFSAEILAIISQAACNPDCDVQKMQALLNMQQQVIEGQARQEFSRAMTAASNEIQPIFKAGRASLGSKGGYSYAKWDDMDRAIRPILQKHGLRLSFTTASSGVQGYKAIIGIITHENGQSERAEMELPIDTGPGRSAIQAIGSTISYGKRYCAEMLLNIVRTDDNDGAPPAQRRVETVTQEQKEELVNLLQQNNFSPAGLLSFYGISAIDDLPQAKFSDALRRTKLEINKRRAAQ